MVLLLFLASLRSLGRLFVCLFVCFLAFNPASSFVRCDVMESGRRDGARSPSPSRQPHARVAEINEDASSSFNFFSFSLFLAKCVQWRGYSFIHSFTLIYSFSTKGQVKQANSHQHQTRTTLGRLVINSSLKKRLFFHLFRRRPLESFLVFLLN